MTDVEYDIFIAYKREDRDTAYQLLSILEAEGFSVFIDTSIHAGSHFTAALEQALEASRSVVVLWSEKSKSSFYVVDEAAEGRDRGVLFPVLIEDTRIPYGFRQIQTVNLCDWNGKSSHPECKSLLNALVARLRSDEEMSPVPAADDKKSLIRQPGDTYRDTLKDGSQGPVMVVVPSGRFLMGSPNGEGEDDEHPQHEVVIKSPFQSRLSNGYQWIGLESVHQQRNRIAIGRRQEGSTVDKVLTALTIGA